MRAKNCYPVVRFSGTPYRLVLSQKNTGSSPIVYNSVHSILRTRQLNLPPPSKKRAAENVLNHQKISHTLPDFGEMWYDRALRIIYGDQIKGMPYQNALVLANFELYETGELNPVSPLSRKYFQLTAVCKYSPVT